MNLCAFIGVEWTRMDYTTIGDEELVAAARNGDIPAFEMLVRRHSKAVFAHAYRFFGDSSSADDIAQEVFIKVYRSLDSFGDRAAFTTWLFRVTRNVCLDEVRAGRRRPQPVDPLDISEALPDDLSDLVAVSTSVEQAMHALAPEDRDSLSAVGLFGLSYAEAGEALGVPAGTVKSRVFRARRSLMAALDIKKRT